MTLRIVFFWGSHIFQVATVFPETLKTDWGLDRHLSSFPFESLGLTHFCRLKEMLSKFSQLIFIVIGAIVILCDCISSVLQDT